jgi:cobalt/nickel transport system permease protein
MHIPDGFIDGKTAATAAVISVAGLALALRRVRRDLPARRMPLLGLAAAFLFAAQMVNFPVAGGTSGHLMGGVLVAALLGPSAAVVVLTTVLIVQCFLFADGGISALGANVLNMGILGAGGGFLVFSLVVRCMKGSRGRVTAIAFAGWCSTVLASIGCAGELAWSHTVTWSAGFTMMTSTHMLVGIGEGTISALAYLAIQRTRPDLIPELANSANSDCQAAPRHRGELLGYGLLVALAVAVFVAPSACPLPDGLEVVAVKLGFDQRSAGTAFHGVAPDYRMAGIHSAAGATALAGALGTVVVFGLAVLLGHVLVRKTVADKDPTC